jgi:O-acetylhomoserine/O-acetylserine sulfhydrylase-like pyridoxal-dependent enzyme
MVFAALAHAGDNIVSTTNLYGGTYNQLKVFLPRLGIHTKFVDGDRAEDFAAAIDENTKAVYIESIGNPKYNVPDFEAIAKVAHEHGVPLVVCTAVHLSCILPTNSPRLTTLSELVASSFAQSTMARILSFTLPQSGLVGMAQPLVE